MRAIGFMAGAGCCGIANYRASGVDACIAAWQHPSINELHEVSPGNMNANLHIQPNACWSGFGSCYSQGAKRVLDMRSVSGGARE